MPPFERKRGTTACLKQSAVSAYRSLYRAVSSRIEPVSGPPPLCIQGVMIFSKSAENIFSRNGEKMFSKYFEKNHSKHYNVEWPRPDFPRFPGNRGRQNPKFFRGAFGATIFAYLTTFYLILQKTMVVTPENLILGPEFAVLSSACLWGHFTLICFGKHFRRSGS